MKVSAQLQHELFLGCATLAAHATHPNGFRQRDLRFYLELFQNWLEFLPLMALPEWQNTQLSRYLEQLAQAAFARVRSRTERIPSYRLTRAGLLEVVRRLTRDRRVVCREQFFFLVYFIESYGPHIEELVRSQEREYPPAIRLELRELLDVPLLIEQELREVRLLLAKLDARMGDALAVAQRAQDLARQGRNEQEIVAVVERAYPYDLSSKKPLSKLIDELPSKQRMWELQHGNRFRVELLWKTAREQLAVYQQQLVGLLGGLSVPTRTGHEGERD